MSVHAAPAKVNLRLAVLAREESGYHQIETLFCALDLADDIEIDVTATSAGIDVTVEGADLGPPEQNLVYLAARAFFRKTGRPACAHIVLRKRIPAGAGLGGGSSDAATTLRALNAALGDPLAPHELLRIGASLGSDVPFFVTASPLALAWGRGDRLLPLPPLPRRPVLVVSPQQPVATADAYAWLAQRRAVGRAGAEPALHDPSSFSDWDAIAAAAVNDFENVVFERLPALARIHAALRSAGAHPALLSGSGSALFGVFGSDAELRAARAAVAAADPEARTFATYTASAPLLAPPSPR